MRPLTKYLLLSFLLFRPLLTISQGNDYRFEQLPPEIGFSNVGVSDILEDHRGFLWLATWSGLVKYDGYSVRMYHQGPGNANGLKSNKITRLFEDSKGRLWFGTNYTGFYRYDREQDAFVQYCHTPGNMNSLSNDNVWSVFEDRDGIFWIGTENGLNRFNPETGQFVHYKHDPSDTRSLNHNFVYSIAQTPDGSLWIGTEEGLNRLVRKEGQEYFVHYNLAAKDVREEDFLAHNFAYHLIPSRFDPHLLWVCTSIGLQRVHFSDKNFDALDVQFFGHNSGSLPLSHRFVPDVWEQDSSKLWVATYQGLNLLDFKNGRIQYFNAKKGQPNHLNTDVILSLGHDRTGNLWIGTDKGVTKLNLRAKAFNSISFDEEENTTNNIMTIALASGNKGLWTGSRGGGLAFLPITENSLAPGKVPGSGRYFHIVTRKQAELAGFISSILLDREGWLWLATDGAGLIRIREADVLAQDATLQNFQQFTKEDPLSDDYVMSLLQTTSSDIWLGYWDKGLDRYDPVTGAFHHYLLTKNRTVNLQDFPVVHLIETVENGKSYLWLGTRGGGVYKLFFNQGENVLELVKHYHSNNNREGSLSNDFTNCFHHDASGRLWIGTESGINLLDKNTDAFFAYSEKDGLSNSIIQSILSDKKGNIWVSTQGGVSRLLFDGGQLTIHNFDTFDGLQDNFFNDDAAVLTASGELAFGGVNGLNVFRPEAIEIDSIPPKVVITDFLLFNKPVPIGKMEDGRTILSKNISETSHLSLSYEDNVISFEFTGLHFGEPKKIRYAYQLEGFDPGWVYADANQRTAHYTNLPYDDYIFKVKAANSDGVWSEHVMLHLTVRPPFWQTGWAYFIYTLLFAGLFYGIFRIIKLRAAFQHSLELERVEREKLEEVNRLKLQFFTNISHELRTPLTLIISPLEQLLQEQTGDRKLHKLFTRMHFNANRLLTMINQLLDIRKSEAGLMKLHVEKSDIVVFSREIVTSFRNLAHQRNIHLKFSADPEHINAWFDHDQLEKVLFNLLSNAFKFTEDGGKVTFTIQQTDFVEISVRDTGAGISPDQLPFIFERFYQVEKSQEWARKGGTGIGLSLAKSIIENHHGSIGVESEVGTGSTFQIKLLRGSAHFTEEEKRPLETPGGSTTHFILSDLPDEQDKTNSNGHPKTNPEKPLLLIVEDNPDVRAYLLENLEDDYRIQQAVDGVDGLEKALAEPPELLISDIAMPRMDGIELCGKIKTNINTSHIPVILLTARTSLVFKVDGYENGADDYVTKPFHIRLLKARIKNLIGSRHRLRERFGKNFDLSPSEVVINSLDEKLLSQIKTVIEKHIDDSGFSVDHLAHAVLMSRVQLYRKLKALTGQSPGQIIRTFRLKRAVQLLESKQYNVTDVMYMVGYNDLKSFREQFKKEFGVSPSGYEKTG
jgi:signal transduction histidine kinase/ligand-binding sensor domain-containing protein/DNA-binding response OmpR family regulator